MIRELLPHEYPELLKEIPEPPRQLRVLGSPPKEGNKLLAVVGSRKYTKYGEEMCRSIIRGLKNQPITIVSGLALGIDSVAHESAIEAGLQTTAIPGSGLDKSVLYPRSNVSLAQRIVEAGGGLLSEYEDTMPTATWAFPQRNRIMAGMCHATLVIEAEKKSGTLITSRLAVEYNRDVGAVPGPLTSSTSEGPHLLIRLGAALIRDSQDVLELLNIKIPETNTLIETEDLSENEMVFIKILKKPCIREELIKKSKLDIARANEILSLLEVKGLITEELGEIRKTF
jgi:DNA processing protein